MSLTPERADALGAALYDARRTRVPIAPLTDADPGLTMADGYLVQQAVVRRYLEAGDRVVGYKLGLTSRPMQEMLGVDSPDFAPVMASHVNADGAAVAAADYIAPRLEAEIALVLGDELSGEDCTPLDVVRATEGVVPALELVDSRVADWRIKLPDTVADMASSGAIVIGGRTTPVADVDLRLLGMVFTRDGEVVATGAGAAALGNPAAAVAWLVRTLHPLGAALPAGSIVMTGALHAAVPVRAGETYRAEFDRLGAVTVRIV
ncbi:MAG TPA: fumarylacetoacetate hydrolase family protein [Candidatus Angelobacter sp.]|nr:fumarylacetoacetate hydrolase family protein [Candidatus Angelobacter sp.]